MPRIGIDLGGTKTEGVALAADGSVLARYRVDTPPAVDGLSEAQRYDAILTTITEVVAHLERTVPTEHPEVNAPPWSVGLGAPGSISRRTGGVKNSNTTCLIGRPLVEDLSARLERPIRIANDANCFALSEAADGAGEGAGVVFGVILGTGVGGGIVMHGSIHEGPHSIAGEWGHTPLEADGPECYCGARGCVETFLSGPGLAADHTRVTGEARLPREIVAAREAEPACGATVERYLTRFGRALATVVDILDPDAVVLGGGLSKLPFLYTEGRAAVAKAVFNDEFVTPIVPARHGDSSGVLGAARLWPLDTDLSEAI